MACLAPDTGNGFLASSLAHLDCQAQTIGSFGYEALAQPGSSASTIVAGLLGLFVALFGFRLIRGDTISFGFLIDNAIKIGIVLALATSWPAYRVLVYDLTLKAPGELFEKVADASDLPGAGGGLAERLQNVDNGILALVAAGTGQLDAARTDIDPLPAKTPLNDSLAVGLARTSYVASILGVLGLLRITGGLLLALGPVMAGLLLFDGTRSFFWGWVRALVATALGALAASIILSVELAILEPWMARVLDLRAARYATPEAPFELLAVTLSFGLILLGALGLCARLAFFSDHWRGDKTQDTARIAPQSSPVFLNGGTHTALAAERQLLVSGTYASPAGSLVQASGPALIRTGALERSPDRMRDNETQSAAVPLGQTYKRTMTRKSALAERRSQTR